MKRKRTSIISFERMKKMDEENLALKIEVVANEVDWLGHHLSESGAIL